MASSMDLGPVIFTKEKGDLLQYLRGKGLLANSMTCVRCNSTMTEGDKRDVTDEKIWRCGQCKTTKSIRKGSFFSRSRMPLNKWMLMIYLWARQYPVTSVAEEAKVEANSAVAVFQWLREVCSTTLLQTNITLGGPGIIVQADESLFRHKPKASDNKTKLILNTVLEINCMYAWI